MFSLRFTVVLLAILLVPYFLRSKYGIVLEPYPAVMLPSGSGKVSVCPDKTEVKYTTLYAQKANGAWAEVDPMRLLYPIPIQYLSPILSREFGLKETSNLLYLGALSPLTTHIDLLKLRTSTPQDKEEVKAWLRAKLKDQNFAALQLKVVETTKPSPSQVAGN